MNTEKTEFRVPRKPKRTPVTIIIGVVCKDAIVVASDSQTTYGTFKRSDAEKIMAVKFQNAEAILATSGNMAISYRIAEITQTLCSSEELIGEWQFAQNVEKAARQVRGMLVDPYEKFNRPLEELNKYCQEYECSFLMAHYQREKPVLFTIDFPPGIAVKQKEYVAVGCGATLAEFLMGWFDFSKMVFGEAALTAAFIIGEVKKADAMCGGRTHINRLMKDEAKVHDFAPEVMAIIETDVEAAAANYKTKWGDSVMEMIGPLMKKLAKFDPDNYST